MFYKPLNEVNLNDLTLLVSNKVKEGIQLDYKLKLPEGNDKGKVEFLRDISAFANTNGGYLIYGVCEEEADGKKTGVAEDIVGIEGLNVNESKLWMENLVRTNIEPRFIGLEFHEVLINSSHTVLIIRVPRGWNLPYVVSFGNHWRFYARNSAGNYQMDITQLRDSFNLGNSITDKLEEKRNERLALIRRNYQTGKPQPLPTLVIHIQPFDSLRPEYLVDIANINTDKENLILGYAAEFERNFNFDGLIIKRGFDYLQIFHSGMTEEVNTRVFSKSETSENFVEARDLERMIFVTVGRRLSLLKSLDIDSPIMVQISLLGINNHKLRAKYVQFQQLVDVSLPDLVDRPDLVTRPVFVESLSNLILEGSYMQGNEKVPNYWNTAQNIVKPALDSIWNAFGAEKCLSFDEEGKWRGWVSTSDAYRFGAIY